MTAFLDNYPILGTALGILTPIAFMVLLALWIAAMLHRDRDHYKPFRPNVRIHGNGHRR